MLEGGAELGRHEGHEERDEEGEPKVIEEGGPSLVDGVVAVWWLRNACTTPPSARARSLGRRAYM